jgi:hypothetical protein
MATDMNPPVFWLKAIFTLAGIIFVSIKRVVSPGRMVNSMPSRIAFTALGLETEEVIVKESGSNSI